KEKNLKISFIHSLAMFFVFIVTTYFVRKYTLNADSTFLWSANLEALLFNLGRIRTYLSLMLTGGIPIILLVVAAKHINYDKSYNFAFAAGVFFSILLIIYSLAAAYT